MVRTESQTQLMNISTVSTKPSEGPTRTALYSQVFEAEALDNEFKTILGNLVTPCLKVINTKSPPEDFNLTLSKAFLNSVSLLSL